MNKRMREILAQIQEKTAEAKGFMSGETKDVAKATAIMDEVETLKAEYATEKRIYEAEKAEGVESAEAHSGAGEAATKTFTAEEIVAKEVRSIMRKVADKDLIESVDEDGGYTVPEDIVTKIHHYPEIVDSLLDEISVENVSTNKGARTYQTKAQTEAFIDLDENGAITKKIEAPKFERVTYTIRDRAGFMPVSNDLIHDSDANINQVVVDWLGRANIATANEKILDLIFDEVGEPVAFDGIAGIKHAVNVILGQAYKAGAKIITNDDGLNYLDTLVDLNGRPLLNPDPTDSAKLALRCGTVVVPVKVKSNQTLPSNDETGAIPFIVGDLKAAIRKYNRQSMSLKASDVAVLGDFNAFAQNMTLIRAILRDDYKLIDGDAFVFGFITPEA